MTIDRNNTALLNALRTCANQGIVEGVPFPKLQRLSGVPLRCIPRTLEHLQELNKIKIIKARGRGRTNIYTITEEGV